MELTKVIKQITKEIITKAGRGKKQVWLKWKGIGLYLVKLIELSNFVIFI